MSPTTSATTFPPFATFAQKCGKHFGVAPGCYLDFTLTRTLYPHARWLRPLLLALDGDFFGPDREFLAGVGRLRRRRDFKIEVWDFHHNTANQGFFRRVLRLRVSVKRTRTLVDALLTNPATGEFSRVREPGERVGSA